MRPFTRRSARQSASWFTQRIGWQTRLGAFLHGVAGFARMMYHRVRHRLLRPFSFWQDRASVRVLRALAACVACVAGLAFVLTAAFSESVRTQTSSIASVLTLAVTIPDDNVVPKPVSAPDFVPSSLPTLVTGADATSETVAKPEPAPEMDADWPEGAEIGQLHAGGPERRGTLAAMSSLDLEEGLRDSISDGSAYNESEEAPLADVARQVDAALLQTMARLNLDAEALDLLHSETRFTEEGLVYPFLRLRVHLPEFPASAPPKKSPQSQDLTKALGEALRVWAPAARLHQEGDALLLIAVDRFVTHSIVLPSTPKIVVPARMLPHTTLPTLVIVIDDMGEDLNAARTLLNLPFPVTFSVWPRSRWANYVATLAHEKGGQVFLHQPMQPVHTGENMGQGGLRVSMTASEVAGILRTNLRLVPNVVGVNNHMGSRFTSARSAVRLFCQALRDARPDIMVLDSLTHGASVLYDEALAQSFVAFRRSLFLDDVRGKEAILKELDHGMELARRDGQAIVIGHPRTDTLEALRSWRGYLAHDVAIVPLAPWPDNTNGGFSATDTELP